MGKRKREKAQEEDAQSSSKNPKDNNKHGGIPVHRGKFKSRFTKKHSMMLQTSTAGFLVSCDVTSEAQTMSEVTQLIPKILRQKQLRITVNEIDQSKKDTTSFFDLVANPKAMEEEKEPSGNELPTKTSNASSGLLTLFDSGCAGLVFAGLRAHIEFDVIEAMESIIDYLKTKPEDDVEFKKFRFSHRIVPIERTCVISMENILKQIDLIMDSRIDRIRSLFEPKSSISFAIDCRITNCQIMKKKQIIDAAAAHIHKQLFMHFSDSKCITVNLTQPDFTVFIGLIKYVAMISLIPQYQQRHCFNVQTLQSAS